MNELPTVSVDDQAAMSTFRELHDAIPEPDQIVLIGGWAVKVRLAEYEGQARPTQDIDALLHSGSRPARDSLSEAGVSQDDPNHSARLSGFSRSVDLLTAHPDSGRRPIPNGHDIPNVVTDPDQLHLAVPAMAHLLASCHSPIELQGQGERADTFDANDVDNVRKLCEPPMGMSCPRRIDEVQLAEL